MGLSDIKADRTFEGWDFLRIGRLSVVPVPPSMWERITELADGGEGIPACKTAAKPGVKRGVKSK